MKAGYKTSEFWLTVLTVVASSAAAIQHILDPKWAAIAACVSSSAYALSRALVKQPV